LIVDINKVNAPFHARVLMFIGVNDGDAGNRYCNTADLQCSEENAGKIRGNAILQVKLPLS